MSTSSTTTTTTPRFVEIGANLLDPMYSGTYRDKKRHDPDLDLVLSRAFDDTTSSTGTLDKIVITAGTLAESREALALARSLGDNRIFTTVGVHPTRCQNFIRGDDDDDDKTNDELSSQRRQQHVDELLAVIKDGTTDGTVVAIGEMGLDYDREQFCPRAIQKEGFLSQLSLAEETGLPLFLHNRNTGDDLWELLKTHRERFTRGVVHSFDDSLMLAQKFVDLDLYIGINGCSLKTEENLKVVKEIPMERLLLETDCPWCDIRPTHAGYKYVKTTFPTKKEKQFERGSCVKNRYEPCHIVQVAEVVAGVKGVSVDELAEVCLKNSYDFYGQFQRP